MNSLGTVQTQSVTLFHPPNPLVLKSGMKLGPIDIAYETYGKLNAEKSNVILIFHTLTSDANAAGLHKGAKNPGWWDDMIGPGKAFDTNEYFIISSNVLGSCKGTTGPASINPAMNKPYGLSFPFVTIDDMVRAQKLLLDHFGIKKVLCAAGGSMGGLQALLWATMYPDVVQSVIAIACNTRHTAQQIALHEVSRQAIMADPDWNAGDYYGVSVPARGMAVARMIGHITYMSEKSMDEKFGRKLIGKEKLGFDFTHDFEVESYLKYRGDSFVSRFDANSYIYLSKALDYFDMAAETSLVQAFASAKAKFLVIAFSSDWLYPAYQSREMVRAIRANDLDVSFIEIQNNYGHDSFLVEVEGQSQVIKPFLKKVYEDR